MDPTLLIGDIVERGSGEIKKPAAFTDHPISSTGFPQHKRRWRNSAFKQQRAAQAAAKDPVSQSSPQKSDSSPRTEGAPEKEDFAVAEKKRIDKENRQKLDSMTADEIAQAQADIMNGLNPALIQRLLKRAVIDESPDPSPFDPPPAETPPGPVPEIVIEDASKPDAPETQAPKQEIRSPKEAEEVAPKPANQSSKKIADDYDEDAAPTQIPPEIFPITDLPKSTHFPAPPSAPDLDPSDPDFLATLHEKYFPSLPADPSKLAWMAPIPTENSPADQDSSYYPHAEIPLAALRFDFRGRFLSPRVSRSIPSSKGLHHHGEAPEAAGYTVAELAHLARSAVPAQRCMAFQTLGRILYRLGHGEWGKGEDDPIAMGIWSSVKKGRVLDSLMEAALGEGGHRGSRAYATEALWLFEKGGWKEKFKGR